MENASENTFENTIVKNLHVSNINDQNIDLGFWSYVSTVGLEFDEPIQAGQVYILSYVTIKDLIENSSFYENDMVDANFEKIRIFSIYEDLTGKRINKESWKLVNPKNIERFSAVAYFFARKIH